jgi:hypothetical protein
MKSRNIGSQQGRSDASFVGESSSQRKNCIDQESIAAVPVPTVPERGKEVKKLSEELKTIGVFAVCSTGGICVHAIDHAEDKVLASMNGKDPKWYDIVEKPLSEITGEEEDNEIWESGFLFGSFFVPFSEVMRV